MLLYRDNKYADREQYQNNDSILNSLNPLESIGAVENVKAAAVYKAMLKTNAEYLIAPKWEIKRDNSFFTTTYTVTVRGYAGKLTSFSSKK